MPHEDRGNPTFENVCYCSHFPSARTRTQFQINCLPIPAWPGLAGRREFIFLWGNLSGDTLPDALKVPATRRDRPGRETQRVGPELAQPGQLICSVRLGASRRVRVTGPPASHWQTRTTTQTASRSRPVRMRPGSERLSSSTQFVTPLRSGDSERPGPAGWTRPGGLSPPGRIRVRHGTESRR
jgi:hypothetical protein